MALGENCSRNCATKDHETFGACMRAKRQMVGYCRSSFDLDRSGTKATEKDLERYRYARSLGIQPDSTHRDSTEFALKASDKFGARYGYGADFRAAPDEKGKLQPVFHDAVREAQATLPEETQGILAAGREAMKEQGRAPRA